MGDVVDNLKARADAVPVWVKERGVSNYMVSVAREDVLSAIAAIEARDRRIAKLEAASDGVYTERNRCVAALARILLEQGHNVGVTKTDIPGWDPGWHGCVYIDGPTGQMSWHFHDSERDLFAGLPDRTFDWDGHSTPEKYDRLAALPTPPKGADQ